MPANLNRVAETSTSTGTGNFTLSGAATSIDSCLRSFASALPSADMFFYYVIKHLTLNEYERGIGYLSGGALVRLKTINSSNGGSLVNFSAGDKLVFAGDAGSDEAHYMSPHGTGLTSIVRRSDKTSVNATSFTLSGNTLYITPYFNPAEIIVTGVGVCVTTAGTAGHVARLGLFEQLTGNSYKMVFDFGTVAVDSTGDKEISTSFVLPAGQYFAGIVAQSGGMRAGNSFATYIPWQGTGFASNSNVYAYAAPIDPTAAFTSTVSAPSSVVVNSAAPYLYLRTTSGVS